MAVPLFGGVNFPDAGLFPTGPLFFTLLSDEVDFDAAVAAAEDEVPGGLPAADDVPLSIEASTLIADTDEGFWSAPAGPGTPAIITFSFLEAPTSQVPAADFSAFSDAMKTGARQALATWAQYAGLTFIEVSSAVGGEIRFGFDATMEGNTVGYAYYPVITEDGESTVGGDIYLLSSRYAGSSGTPGSSAFEVLLHEIGHTLGLKHPFSGSPTLAANFDNTNFTVMSYTHLAGPKSAPQSLDIEAARWLYGTAANAAADGITASFDGASSVLLTAGGADADRAVGINLADHMAMGPGNDALWGLRGNDTLEGGVGDDSLDGGFGNDVLTGGDGADRLDGGGSGNDALDGGPGDDTYILTRSSVSLIDSSGTDTVRASFSYTLPSFIENLVLTDAAFRGTGNEAANAIDGSNQANQLQGNGGDDAMRGFDGADGVYGGAGDDTVNGNLGNDTVHGEAGADMVLGGQAADIVYGGAGNDPHVNGNKGNDVVYGGEGHDTLFGGADHDLLYGELGDDLLSGDLGNDSQYGGSGADRFILRPGAGIDLVLDFSLGDGDRVQVAPGTAVTLESVDGTAKFALADGSALILTGNPAAGASLAWLVSG